MSNKEFEGIGLEFNGSCGKGCQANPCSSGTLVFGTGEWKLASLSWDNKCDVCTDAWRREHRYLFDLVILAQALLIQDGSGSNYYEVSFTNEEIAQIKDNTKIIVTLLSPLESIIKTIIWSIINVLMAGVKLDDFAADYRAKHNNRRRY